MPIHEARWDWVDAAIERFKVELDPSLKSHLDSDRRPGSGVFNIVLYGKTQVGKTTLILRLLGLSGEHEERVGEILRGGRRDGESATAVPTRYYWSSHPRTWETRYWDAFSGQHHESPREHDDAGIKAFMIGLRDELGQPRSDGTVLEIGIPTRFRIPGAPAVVPMVLDLPGAQTKGHVERDHAAQLIRRYVPTANVVILVALFSQMTSLFSGLAQEMNELRTWLDVPEKFRIVFTRTFEEETTQTAIRALARDSNREAITADWLREHVVLPELEKSEPSSLVTNNPELARRVLASVFPLEYGQSWAKLRASDPAYAELCDPVRSDLLRELGDFIVGNAAEDAPRIAMAHTAQTLKLAATRHLKMLISQSDAARRQFDAATEREAGVRKHHQHHQELHSRAVELTDALRTAGRHVFQVSISRNTTKAKTGKKARKGGGNDQGRFSKAWDTQWEAWRKLPSVRLLEKRTGVHTKRLSYDAGGDFKREWNCCGDCTGKGKIRRSLSGRHSPDHCLNRQKNAWEPAKVIAAKKVQAERSYWIEQFEKHLEDPDVAAQRAARSAHDLADSKDKTRLAGVALNMAQLDADNYRPTADRAESAAAKLSGYLNEELDEELTRRQGRLAAAQSDDERTAEALAILLGLQQRERLQLIGENA